jgi:peptidoglycan/LPS O-acetylase OafA/YrhL
VSVPVDGARSLPSSLGAAAPARALPANLEAGLAAKHLAGLDGLRAIAAFLVVFAHAGVPRVPGGMGVLAFFVLSGFLITRLMIVEEVRTGRVSLSQFYLRRSFRIFPAFYAYFVLLLAILVVRHTAINVPQAVSAFFYVSNYYQAINGDPATGFSHTWSLSIEEQFYLLWPLAFLLLGSNRRRFRALIVVVPLLWLYRECLIYALHVPQGYIYEALDTRADHLLIGCLLAVALQERRLIPLWRVACASSANVLATVALIAASTVVGWLVPITSYRDAVEFVVQPVLFAVLVAQLIAFPTEAVTRPLNWTWIRFLGTISYSVYLYQQIVVYPVTNAFHGTPVVGAIAAAIVVVAVAACSYFFVERPFLRLRARVA